MSGTNTHPAVREPAVAGTFYPADAAALRSVVDQCFTDAARVDRLKTGSGCHAVIAPHAGFRYSGAVAAIAFDSWRADAAAIQRVVVLGPSHHFRFDGVALSRAAMFRTPLGDLPVDTQAVNTLHEAASTIWRDDVHAPEHALETHLPFLQVLLGEPRIVPMLVGDIAADTLADLLRPLLDEPGTRLAVSSDLSHFLPADRAAERDAATAEAIVQLSPEPLTPCDACGAVAINGLLALARERKWEATNLLLRHSGHAGGPMDRVVGYGAFRFD